MSEIATAPQGDASAVASDATSVAPPIDISKLTPEQIEQIVSGHKVKLRINGKDKEMTYAEVRKNASLAEAANERFTSAKQMKTEAEQLKKAIESGDIRGTLRSMGKSPAEIKRIMEDSLLAELEEEAMDPKDRELREYKKEKEDRLKAEAEAKAEADRAAKDQEVVKYQKKFETEMIDALAKSNMPKTALSFKMVAQEMISALENDIQMTAEEAVQIAEKHLMDAYLEVLPKLGADKLKKALGKDLLRSLQEDQIREIRDASASLPKAQKQPAEKKASNDEPPVQETQEQYFRRLRYGRK